MPSTRPQLNIRMPESERQEIVRLARQRGTSQAQLIRDAVKRIRDDEHRDDRDRHN